MKISNLSFFKFHSGFSRKSSRNGNQPQRAQRSTSIEKQKSSVGKNYNFQPKAEEIKWVFDKFDTNKDGKISLEEYRSALKAMERGIAEAEAVKGFTAMDTDGDGFIDFKEFLELFNHAGGSTEEASDIWSAFKVFDLDGDGRISAEELSQVLKRLGEGSSLSACKKMVKGVDSNGDGSIDLDEFLNMMATGKKITN